MNEVLQERPGKRQNIKRWRKSRIRRLSFLVEKGWASIKQMKRLDQLERSIDA